MCYSHQFEVEIKENVLFLWNEQSFNVLYPIYFSNNLRWSKFDIICFYDDVFVILEECSVKFLHLIILKRIKTSEYNFATFIKSTEYKY